MKTENKKDLVKTKRIISASIGSHMYYHVQRKEYQQKDDIEEPTEECEDTKLRDHAVPLHKGFSN